MLLVLLHERAVNTAIHCMRGGHTHPPCGNASTNSVTVTGRNNQCISSAGGKHSPCACGWMLPYSWLSMGPCGYLGQNPDAGALWPPTTALPASFSHAKPHRRAVQGSSSRPFITDDSHCRKRAGPCRHVSDCSSCVASWWAKLAGLDWPNPTYLFLDTLRNCCSFCYEGYATKLSFSLSCRGPVYICLTELATEWVRQACQQFSRKASSNTM